MAPKDSGQSELHWIGNTAVSKLDHQMVTRSTSVADHKSAEKKCFYSYKFPQNCMPFHSRHFLTSTATPYSLQKSKCQSAFAAPVVCGQRSGGFRVLSIKFHHLRHPISPSYPSEAARFACHKQHQRTHCGCDVSKGCCHFSWANGTPSERDQDR